MIVNRLLFVQISSFYVRKIQRCISKEEIDAAFSVMDVDNNGIGVISKKELSDTAAKSAYNIPEDQVEETSKMIDLEQNGKVDFEEFKKAIDKKGDNYNYNYFCKPKSAFYWLPQHFCEFLPS